MPATTTSGTFALLASTNSRSTTTAPSTAASFGAWDKQSRDKALSPMTLATGDQRSGMFAYSPIGQPVDSTGAQNFPQRLEFSLRRAHLGRACALGRDIALRRRQQSSESRQNDFLVPAGSPTTTPSIVWMPQWLDHSRGTVPSHSIRVRELCVPKGFECRTLRHTGRQGSVRVRTRCLVDHSGPIAWIPAHLSVRRLRAVLQHRANPECRPGAQF